MLTRDFQKLAELPKNPGVYLFKQGESVLYVGKAGVLRDRVRSYFGAGADAKVRAITNRADGLEWIVTDSEVEALILESTLVRKHAPRYNIDLKDDKRFPYLRVTVSDAFPRLEVVRRVARDGEKYFGPYTDPGKMRRVLRLLERVFRLRTCRIALPARAGTRPCLNFQIGKCAGPCTGVLSPEAYRENVNGALLFLGGRGRALIEKIKQDMARAANAQDFEKAAELRDHLAAMDKVLFRQRMSSPDTADRDIAAAAVSDKSACVAVFTVREGAVTGRHHFFFSLAGGETGAEVLAAFLPERYHREVDMPPEILVSDAPGNPAALEEALTREAGFRVRILVPVKGEKARLLDLCRRNAEMLLAEILTDRDARTGKTPAALEALKKELGLLRLPVRIEAYDISHFQGRETVASRVVFVEGKPRRSLYRHYNVKTVEGVDDFASMHEIISRRARSSREEGGEALPDLMLIDGGKGQLSAALDALTQAGVHDQPVLALAKRLEEVFLTGRDAPVMLARRSPALHLLQRVRDEAHRFAVSFHRKKRDKNALVSVLDGIPGIGEKRKMKLLKKFGSVAEIKKQPLEVLISEGLSEKTAKMLAFTP
ncbi:MAG: excinuclease ABC subunit UvrC [Fibrobacterota bacterium]